MSDNHVTELEEAAKARAEQATKLRSEHDAEISQLATEKSELILKISDLEGELATIKATLEAEPVVYKGNGSVAPQSPGVSAEDLQRMHEAHNLKLGDLISEHEKAVKLLEKEREEAVQRALEAEESVRHKAMELHLLETESTENQEEITRYVKLFGLKGFVGSMIALVAIYAFI